MEGDWIQEISRAAGGVTEQVRGQPPMGMFYLSNGRNDCVVRYDAEVPAGIHIGCGLAPAMMSEADFGEICLTGSGLTLLSSREPTQMSTTLSTGEFRSAGLSIGWQALAEYPLLPRFVAMHANSCIAIEKVPARILAELTTPIDDWFQGAARDLVHEARALALLAILEQCLDETAYRNVAASRSRTLAASVRDIIESEYASPLSIGSLAVRLNCSPRTLTSAFRRSFETSIGAYLTRCRLAAAASLLRSGCGATQTAYRVGYSPAHFATAFKRRFGVSPRHWLSDAAEQRKSLPLSKTSRR